jgi:cell division control protein 45
MLGIDAESEGEGAFGGVEVWVVDAQRQWHLENVFGGAQRDGVLEDGSPGPIKQQPGVDNGKIGRGFKPGKGGIIVFDDGDIEEELGPERAAYFALDEMPAIDEREDDGESESEEDEDTPMIEARPGQKRKSWSDREDDDSDEDDDRPRQRRRSNSVSFASDCHDYKSNENSRAPSPSLLHDPNGEGLWLSTVQMVLQGPIPAPYLPHLHKLQSKYQQGR